MTTHRATTVTRARSTDEEGVLALEVPALVVVWSSGPPDRIGNVALFPEAGRRQVLGRGEPRHGDDAVQFHRQRPGVTEARPAFAGAGLSRRQLAVERAGDGLLVEVLGRCPVFTRGARVERRATLAVGNTLLLERELLLLCTRRPLEMAPLRHFAASAVGPFGEADAAGIVGEGVAAWALREDVAFAAALPSHALVVGPGGSGKALAARAIHALSSRASGPFVVARGARLEADLEAELFGEVTGHRHAGAPGREGLLEQAHGGTLYVDGFAALPGAVRARLIDAVEAGDHRRLGSTASFRADVRLVVSAADRDALGEGVAERFVVTVACPPLDARREDIPLLVRRLVRVAAHASPELVRRFVDRHGAVQVDPRFLDHLIGKACRGQIDELEADVLRAMRESPGKRLGATPRAVDGAAAPTRAGARRERPAPARLVFEREGDVWRVATDDRELRVKDVKGLAYLDHLIRHPDEEFHCLDLVILVDAPETEFAGGSTVGATPRDLDGRVRPRDRGDGAPVLDAKAKASYRARLTELRADLEEATSFADLARAGRARREMEALAEQLARAVGLGGRDRKAAGSSERARINVQRRLRDAIERIQSHDAALGRYLARTVKTGAYVSYVPVHT